MSDSGALLRQAGLALTPESLQGLAVYQEMLVDWNGRMDLTNVPADEIPARHFLDSLLPLTVEGLFPKEARIIDVGTGAGFPGLALAIARPDLRVTLLEAQGKRCAFLHAVIERLGLNGAQVIQDRAEVLGRAAGHRESYDRAVARAVAPLNVLCEYLLPFVRVGGCALCWKGPALKEEEKEGAYAARLLGGRMTNALEMPGAVYSHVLARIDKIEETLPQYPRKNGMPAKRPLRDDKK